MTSRTDAALVLPAIVLDADGRLTPEAEAVMDAIGRARDEDADRAAEANAQIHRDLRALGLR
jgi:hypothetical protein